MAEDVGEEVEQYFMERAADFPGVIVERRTPGSTPTDRSQAHILGYVGEINDERLLACGAEVPGATSSPRPRRCPGGPEAYEAGDSIGKTGVERAYEEDPPGSPRERTIEVNARGEMLDVVSETPPCPARTCG
ncbi:MAG: hypothetical protein R2716_00855 [Microthrixaceae bacterium]